MKLLMKAALRTRKHLSLVIITFSTLFILTIANQLEMFALGVLSNVGSDFFSEAPVEKVQEVSSSLVSATKFEANPLQFVMKYIKENFQFASNLNALILMLLMIAIFKAIWLFTSRYATQLLAIRVSRDLRQQYFEHIQSLSMNFYQQHNIGSLSSRVVGDAGQIASSINSCLTNFFQTPFTLVTTLCMCFYLSWQLSLVIFIGFPLIVLPIIFLAKRVKRVTRQLQVNQEKFASVLIDFLTGVQTVKMFAMELFSLKKYKEQNDRMAVLEAKTAKYGLLTRPILHAITTACLAIVVIFGLYTLKMTISELLVFCGLLQLVYEPIKKFAEENSNIQRGVIAAERMFDVLHLKPSIEDHKDAVDLDGFKDKIEFDRVWFRYQGEWVLKDVSFTVHKGETLAIVGPTGAGKSTIVHLMPRLYDVERGEIRIDGKPLQAYTQKSLRENIAFVSQKPFVFLDTIASNISFGRNFSKEDIESASKRAYADEFITRMPEKYNSMMAEGGKNLSGGQLQRLAIARALVKKAPILILDEATSSLDALSENHIKAAISNLHGEVTQLLIAHRLSTIEHADKIIYLERGEKIAEGTRDELLQTCEPFRLTWEAMFHSEKTRTPEVVTVE
ncbi:MAG: ABC transporter ATP-binding protein [Chlamydiae bacterium]|nr:ABC transporter ATP-binding protein [Chlamydiota bacterium]